MAGLASGRGVVTALAAALLVLGATGCDLRRETPAPVWPTPDATTVARDALAAASQAVIDAADREGASGTDAGFAPTAARVAGVHVDTLGGVYVAHPDATASPAPSATASPLPVPVEPTLREAIEAARLAAQGAIASTDPELASLARAIDLEWALRVALTLRTDDDPGEAPVGRVPFPLAGGGADEEAGFAPTSGTGVSQEHLAAFALAHDHARFAHEAIAAWEQGTAREEALARAAFHAACADEFAALLESDPRTSIYQLREADLPDPQSRRALELALELDIALTLVGALDGASSADAPWLLNAAFDAFTRASRAEGFAASDIPSLPGLRVVAPSS